MTATREELDVRGYRDEPLPHEFYRHGPAARGLALLLPGVGYGPHLPGLHFAAQVFRERGLDTFALDTRYNTPAFHRAAEIQALAWLRADVLGAYRAACGASGAPPTCLLGKSLGTLGLVLLLRGAAVPPGARLVWLTPMLARAEIRQAMAEHAARSLVIAGTLDDHARPEWLGELREAGAQLLVLDGVDHALRVPGDTRATLRALGQMVDALDAFIS